METFQKCGTKKYGAHYNRKLKHLGAKHVNRKICKCRLRFSPWTGLFLKEGERFETRKIFKYQKRKHFFFFFTLPNPLPTSLSSKFAWFNKITECSSKSNHPNPLSRPYTFDGISRHVLAFKEHDDKIKMKKIKIKIKIQTKKVIAFTSFVCLPDSAKRTEPWTETKSSFREETVIVIIF